MDLLEVGFAVKFIACRLLFSGHDGLYLLQMYSCSELLVHFSASNDASLRHAR